MKISAESEKKLIKAFLYDLGLDKKDSDIMADVVCRSDMTGVYSHGLSRFIRYIQQFETGALNPTPDMRIVSDSGATLMFECDGASGLIAVNRAYDEALVRAKEHGVCVCCGANSANLGCGNYYGTRAASDGMLFILMSNTYPCMAPFGGRDLLMGTNPIIMAAPGEDEMPLVLDVSTSNVAMGRITSFRREGRQLPPGWANDEEGRPTTDPEKAYAVTPMGKHKGYGLAMFVDIFSAVLTGSLFLNNIPPVEELKPESTGFTMILIDIEKFMPLPEFRVRMGEYASAIKNSRTAEGVKEILLPGELEYRKFAESGSNGAQVSDAVMEELRELAVARGLLKEGESIEKLL